MGANVARSVGCCQRPTHPQLPLPCFSPAPFVAWGPGRSSHLTHPQLPSHCAARL